MPAAHAATDAEAHAVAARLAFFALAAPEPVVASESFVTPESFIAPDSLAALEAFVARGAAHEHAAVAPPVTPEDCAESLLPSHAEVLAVRPAAVATDCPAPMKPVVVPTHSVVTPLRLRARRRDDDQRQKHRERTQ